MKRTSFLFGLFLFCVHSFVFAQSTDLKSYYDYDNYYDGYAVAVCLDSQRADYFSKLMDSVGRKIDKLSKNNKWLCQQALNEWELNVGETYYVICSDSSFPREAIIILATIKNSKGAFTWRAVHISGREDIEKYDLKKKFDDGASSDVDVQTENNESKLDLENIEDALKDGLDKSAEAMGEMLKSLETLSTEDLQKTMNKATKMMEGLLEKDGNNSKSNGLNDILGLHFHKNKQTGYTGISYAKYLDKTSPKDFNTKIQALEAEMKLSKIKKLSKKQYWLCQEALYEWETKPGESYAVVCADAIFTEKYLLIFATINADNKSFEWFGFELTLKDLQIIKELLENGALN